MAYPNMALHAPSADRAVVISHGHFTESIYTLMSQLKDILYPDQRPTSFNDVAVWEQENFAWIDFLWSTLGRSGQVGTDLGLIYADMASPADIDGLISNLTRSMLSKGGGPGWLHRIEGAVVNAIIKHEATHFLRSERGTTDTTLSPVGEVGLRTYLEGPVRNQLQNEMGGVPAELSFVFGHTHKPFADIWPIVGFPSPVRIFNTGGWVVDTAAPAPVQGGVMVLIDDNLEVVPVQIYRQSAVSSFSPVQLLPEKTSDGSPPSEFRSWVAARIDPATEPWASITAAASTLTAQRHRLQAATMAAYHEAPPRPDTDKQRGPSRTGRPVARGCGLAGGRAAEQAVCSSRQFRRPFRRRLLLDGSHENQVRRVPPAREPSLGLDEAARAAEQARWSGGSSRRPFRRPACCSTAAAKAQVRRGPPAPRAIAGPRRGSRPPQRTSALSARRLSSSSATAAGRYSPSRPPHGRSTTAAGRRCWHASGTTGPSPYSSRTKTTGHRPAELGCNSA